MISLGRLVGGGANGTDTRVTGSGPKEEDPIHVREPLERDLRSQVREGV